MNYDGPMKNIAGLVVLIISISCAAAPGPTPRADSNSTATLARFDAIYARFSRAYEQLDPDQVADLYTEDALYLRPRGDIERGRDVIRAGFASMFERTRTAGDTLRISFERIDRHISGDLAFEVGYYTLVRTSATGDEKVSRGKFTVVLRRASDGTWRFAVDGYSPAPPVNRPAEPGAAGADLSVPTDAS